MGTRMNLSRTKQDILWARIRRGMLAATGIWCVAFGIGLIGTLVDTGMLSSTNTTALLMIVGVIVLPAATLLTLRQDTKVLGRIGTQRDDAKAFTERPVIAHRRHDRSLRHTVHAPSRAGHTDTHTKVA
ncbi:MAG: hypothetical protein JKY96_05180 [Phycisphaerales bacterium]|nr:hypothetical protein [Phycisphaerales bacterium]